MRLLTRVEEILKKWGITMAQGLAGMVVDTSHFASDWFHKYTEDTGNVFSLAYIMCQCSHSSSTCARPR